MSSPIRRSLSCSKELLPVRGGHFLMVRNSSTGYKTNPQQWDSYPLPGTFYSPTLNAQKFSKSSNFKSSLRFSWLVSGDFVLGYLWKARFAPLFFPFCFGAYECSYTSFASSLKIRFLNGEWDKAKVRWTLLAAALSSTKLSHFWNQSKAPKYFTGT